MQNLEVIVEKNGRNIQVSVQKCHEIYLSENVTSCIEFIFIFWICEDFVNYSGQPVSI